MKKKTQQEAELVRQKGSNWFKARQSVLPEVDDTTESWYNNASTLSNKKIAFGTVYTYEYFMWRAGLDSEDV